MKTVTLEVDETTDARLSALAERCDATPGQFVDMLCASLDNQTLERLIHRAIRDETLTSVPGVARMPERRRRD